MHVGPTSTSSQPDEGRSPLQLKTDTNTQLQMPSESLRELRAAAIEPTAHQDDVFLRKSSSHPLFSISQARLPSASKILRTTGYNFQQY